MFRKVFLALLVLVAFSPAFGQVQYVEVFVTSDFQEGDFGGLAGANIICENAAANATPPLSGNWVAWLSDSQNNAESNVPDAQYRLLDGTVVAANIGDLTDGTLDAAINLSENLALVTTFAWTGTLQDGTSSGQDCNGWTNGGFLSVGTVGDTDDTGPRWTDSPPAGLCDLPRPLYCFAAAAVPVEVQKFSVD